MKAKKNLYLALILFAVVFTSCDKDNKNSTVQLLGTISVNGKLRTKFEYDEQYRISKVINYDEFTGKNISYTQTYGYDSDGDLVSIYYDFSENEMYENIDANYLIFIPKPIENKITTNGQTIELNEQGLPLKTETFIEYEHNNTTHSYSWTYEYENGNIKKITYVSVRTGYEPWRVVYNNLTFDDKKTPFHNCNTPKWSLVLDFGSVQNNVLSLKTTNSNYPDEELPISYYTYTYDNAGFPKTMKTESSNPNIEWAEERIYTYIKM